MTSIRNHADLVIERHRIEDQIDVRKANLQHQLTDIKVKLEPFLYLLPILKIFKKKDNNNNNQSASPLLKLGAVIGAGWVTRKVLSRYRWFTKLTMPVFLSAMLSRR